MSETSEERRVRLQRQLADLYAQEGVSVDESSVFATVLEQLDAEPAEGGEVEWGDSFRLDIGITFVGWWRSQDAWSTTGSDGEALEIPVYLLRDAEGRDCFIWGGRAQLDKRIKGAGPRPGDRIAIRRLEDAPAEPGRNPAWRVRVAVAPGNGTMPGDPPGDSEPLF